MKALLIRVGIDSVYGNWNAPVNCNTREFVYVPIPEYKRIHPGFERPYREFCIHCKKMGVHIPEQLLRYESTHLDPDFNNLTYGDEGSRGEPLWDLEDGDLLAFYVALLPIKPCEHRLIYALIGLYVVDKVIPAGEIRKQDWDRNAHTRRTFTRRDIVVFAKPEVSGRLERCIPIGEFRSNAYRVKTETLDEWGGLAVKDGYIQRSARLPRFSNPTKFYEWFKRQNIGLVARNN